MPQLEDGFTRIANELFDALLAAQFTLREYNIVLCVIRKTYGFNKREDDMTMSQIAKKTGIARPHCSKTCTDLVHRKVLNSRDGRHGKILSVNKHYRQWVYQNGTPMCTETVQGSGVYQNGTQGVPKRYGRRTETVRSAYQNGTHKRQPQKTTPKDTPNRQRASARTTAKRARICPADWKPSAKDLAAVEQVVMDHGVNLDAETAQFCDHEFDKPKSDWSRAWRNWIRNSVKFNRSPARRPVTARDDLAASMRLIAEMDAEEAVTNG